MVGRDGGQKFRGQPEGKVLKATRMPESLRELFAGLGSHHYVQRQAKVYHRADAFLITKHHASVAELADAWDLKPHGGNTVRVQFSPFAPKFLDSSVGRTMDC